MLVCVLELAINQNGLFISYGIEDLINIPDESGTKICGIKGIFGA